MYQAPYINLKDFKFYFCTFDNRQVEVVDIVPTVEERDVTADATAVSFASISSIVELISAYAAPAAATPGTALAIAD